MAAFVLTLSLGAGATTFVHTAETASAQLLFEREAKQAVDRLSERVDELGGLLTASRAFLMTQNTGPVSRERFADYVAQIDLVDGFTGVQGLGFAQIIAEGQDDRVLDRLRGGYGPEARLWPEVTDGDIRTAIVLLEPAVPRNLAAIGYDMYSEPDRRRAMAAALLNGGIHVTAPVTLVQEITSDRQTGVLMYQYVPATEAGEAPGFVYSPVRMGDLFGATVVARGPDLLLRAHDRDTPEPALFQSDGFDADPTDGRITVNQQLEVGGRVWVISAQQSTPGTVFERIPFTLIFAAGSLALAVATAVAVQGIGAFMRRSQELAAAQARHIREKDLHLREMSHRLKNSLARVLAMARRAARSAETKEDFVEGMIGRLQSMAAAQDMLTRSATARADLATVLQAELKQIHGDTEGMAAPEGPPVMLSAQETQSLGLVFHELATNSLKYGAGNDPEGCLAIRWTVSGGGKAGRQLRLVWDERTTTPPTPPEKGGFGSQLIDSCVRIELGGTIDRTYHDKGLTVVLTVPLGRA